MDEGREIEVCYDLYDLCLIFFFLGGDIKYYIPSMNIHEHSKERDWSIAAHRVKNNFTINLKSGEYFSISFPGQHCACSIMLSSSWALLRMLTNA